jgi:hypothetical protein
VRSGPIVVLVSTRAGAGRTCDDNEERQARNRHLAGLQGGRDDERVLPAGEWPFDDVDVRAIIRGLFEANAKLSDIAKDVAAIRAWLEEDDDEERE